MSYLLDTNVISELRKRHPDPHVLAWYEGVASADLFISVLTVGEIRLGIQRLRRKDTVQADVLERWLRGLRAAYGDHIVDVDVGIAEHWGRLNVPDPLPVIDGLLAGARTEDEIVGPGGVLAQLTKGLGGGGKWGPGGGVGPKALRASLPPP